MKSIKLNFFLNLILFISFILLVPFNIYCQEDSDNSPRKVLYISSYHPAFPSFFQQTDGLESIFRDKNIILDIEFMDTKRFPGEANWIGFQNQLIYKLKYIDPYDVVVVADDNALIFALDQQNELFSGIPIVFLGVNNIQRAMDQNKNPQLTGVVEAVSMEETIELMIKLRPEAENIIALVDATPSGQGDLESFYKIGEKINSHIFSEISLASLNWQDFWAQLENLDERSAVLLLSAYKDKNNRTYIFEDSFQYIKDHLKEPLFHLWYHGLGDGVLGGKVISHYEQGRTAANIVLDIIEGKDVSDIPVINSSPNLYVFDYIELKKHNISESKLPNNSIILNEPYSFYKENKTLVWTVIAVIVILSFLLFLAILNIFKRKKTEKELRESEEKLSTLFETMTEIVVLNELVFNDKGEPINYRITDCNNAFTAVMGIKKENAKGRLATEVYDTENAPYLDVYSKVATTRIPYEYTTYFAPLDKHFSISVVSPKENNFATIMTDITAIQESQKVISDKNKELENYLYVASHDLRTPLVNVQGFSNRLKKQVDSIKTLIDECSLAPEREEKIESLIEEKLPGTLDFIFTNVKKMDVLITALLEISRTGRVKMTIKKVNINQLLKQIVSSMNFQIAETSTEVNISEMPDCYGDQNLLNQLFTNILSNAIKYRNQEIPLIIEISSETNYNKVIYRFKDNGIGIEKRHLEKIWDVFYRVGSVPLESGEGIGLSLAKRIVDKHKGKIWVESEEGKGSIFSIELLTNDFSE